MTPLQHRFVLPPILLVLHGIFLLPLLIPTPSLNHGTPIPPVTTDVRLLHLEYSVPLGLLGFLVVFVAKQLAVNIPLPKDSRRKQLAAYLEWTVLFMLGTLEEVWRWGLVRILVGLEGGDGGYGRGGLGKLLGRLPKVDAGAGLLDCIQVEGLWQGIYFMGWIWCLVESGFAWWSFAPHAEAERPIHHHHHHHHGHHHNHRRDRSFRTRGDRSPEDSAGGSGYPHSRDGLTGNNTDNGSPCCRQPAWNGMDARRKGSKISLFSRELPRVDTQSLAPEQARPTFGSPYIFGQRYTFQPRASHIEPSQSPPSPTAPTFGGNEGQAMIAEAEEDENSDNDFGDDEDDSHGSDLESGSSSIRSSSETVRSRAETPLLSSSLPYDPFDEHPHHEQQSLLTYQHRRMSYNTMGDNYAARSDSSHDEGTQDVQIHVRDVDGGDDSGRPSPPRLRTYPTYPSYSASYNHSHFSAHLNHSNSSRLHVVGSPQGPSSPTNNTFPPHVHHSQPPHVHTRPKPVKLPTHHYLRMIYGVDTNSLGLYLPIMWRASAILRSLGHMLIYAWFPNIFHRGQFQTWTCIVLILLSTQRGWHTVEWVGGEVARSGVLKVTLFTTLFSLVTFVIGLGLWDLFV
ncbi:hypothetical protein DFH27DRAFT_249626 [Peziza echinospora]|nr:hypothetical protein DFH27DRAFT_249626 [Peziza echinospora]